MERTQRLLTTSLPSVYQQQSIDARNVSIIIVDDNNPYPISHEYAKIKQGVFSLRHQLGLHKHAFSTQILPNTRTKGNSGTGAWNTGIYHAYSSQPHGYISILDDDDEYLPNHLSDCLKIITSKRSAIAVFQRLYWQNADGTTLHFPLTKQALSPRSFFIGNPGVQGSNMFFKTSALIQIRGFDETFPNTTDRELMIRFLWHATQTDQLQSVYVSESLGVIRHNHSQVSVNNQLGRKQKGLNLFYKKFRSSFSEDDFTLSLKRAKQFFNYIPQSS